MRSTIFEKMVFVLGVCLVVTALSNGLGKAYGGCWSWSYCSPINPACGVAPVAACSTALCNVFDVSCLNCSCVLLPQSPGSCHCN